MVKKIYDDYQQYKATYDPWACKAYLPRPTCK
jgi:hypothetical protein